ncbi:MerR family transcriptional regulator [Deinococcus aquaedulcis]|uniref:MerR family transcriptional regulator n=1 Tax=Deinococcus aquaedulcis TaxID=2840455 RepID=UPI001C830697|nr:MerR family transcriptional regulator [Deinococcus aquaedulcis]
MAQPPLPLSIQDAAAHLGVSAHTLRYYDREGLLAVPRGGGSKRQYTSAELGLLRMLIRLRRTGMGMAGLREFSRLIRLGEAGVPARRALLVAHEQAVVAQLGAMQGDLQAIRDKIALYDHLHPEVAPAPSPAPLAEPVTS